MQIEETESALTKPNQFFRSKTSYSTSNYWCLKPMEIGSQLALRPQISVNRRKANVKLKSLENRWSLWDSNFAGSMHNTTSQTVRNSLSSVQFFAHCWDLCFSGDSKYYRAAFVQYLTSCIKVAQLTLPSQASIRLPQTPAAPLLDASLTASKLRLML